VQQDVSTVFRCTGAAMAGLRSSIWDEYHSLMQVCAPCQRRMLATVGLEVMQCTSYTIGARHPTNVHPGPELCGASGSRDRHRLEVAAALLATIMQLVLSRIAVRNSRLK